MVTTKNLIALPEGAAGANAGIITWWSLDGEALVDEVCDALKGIVPDKFLPRPQGASSSLARAVKRVCSAKRSKAHGVIALRRDRDSWWIVNRQLIDAGASVELAAFARVEVSNGAPVDVFLDDGNYDVVEEIICAAQTADLRLSSGAFSGWLSHVHARLLYATSLRPTGGFYYVPPANRPLHAAIWEALYPVTQHRMFSIDAMPTEDTIDAVFAALERDCETAFEDLKAVLGDIEAPERSRAAAKRRAEDLAKKIDAYRAIIGSGVDALADRLLTINTALTFAQDED